MEKNIVRTNNIGFLGVLGKILSSKVRYRHNFMKFLVLSSACFFLLFSHPTSEGKQIGHAAVREMGTVRWNRNLGKVAEIAKSDNKPIFMLFQEVPG